MKKPHKKSGDWFFGMGGLHTFLVSAALILAVCFVDKFHGGKNWVPTYGQHILVNCLLSAVLALGLDFVSGYLGQTSLGHAACYGFGG